MLLILLVLALELAFLGSPRAAQNNSELAQSYHHFFTFDWKRAADKPTESEKEPDFVMLSDHIQKLKSSIFDTANLFDSPLPLIQGRQVKVSTSLEMNALASLYCSSQGMPFYTPSTPTEIKYLLDRGISKLWVHVSPIRNILIGADARILTETFPPNSEGDDAIRDFNGPTAAQWNVAANKKKCQILNLEQAELKLVDCQSESSLAQTACLGWADDSVIQEQLELMAARREATGIVEDIEHLSKCLDFKVQNITPKRLASKLLVLRGYLLMSYLLLPADCPSSSALDEIISAPTSNRSQLRQEEEGNNEEAMNETGLVTNLGPEENQSLPENVKIILLLIATQRTESHTHLRRPMGTNETRVPQKK